MRMSKKIENEYLEKKEWKSDKGKTGAWHFEMIEKNDN